MSAEQPAAVERPRKTVLLIPVYNNALLTDACLHSIFDCEDQNPAFEVLVVDDGSDEETKAYLERHPITLLTNEVNRGYLYTVNRGLRHALDELAADYVVLMNNDMDVRGDWLARLIAPTRFHGVAVTGYFGRWSPGKKLPVTCTGYLEGSCLLGTRELFERIGVLDPAFGVAYYSDDDLCLRARVAGYNMCLVDVGKDPLVRHYHSKTFGHERRRQCMRDGHRLFLAKWSQQQHHPVVAEYLDKWLYNPEPWFNRFMDKFFETFRLGPFKPVQDRPRLKSD